jgi:DHA3 family tetracycline resistance protein-like MFS transporter
MQHSHEALDRPGGFGRSNLASPLRHRDFRILWTGMTISLIGDGIFLIAIAWESYSLWNAPAALSIVGIGMTIPTIAFLLIGGVVSDRRDRRLIMAWADGLRAVAVAVLAVLVLMGALRFWELVVLVAVYGVGTAFFMPAFDAILPELLPKSDLPAANALDQFVRPIAMRLIGPVAGGALVAASAGLAFAIDAASFAACLVAVLVMPRRASRNVEVQTSSVVALKEGLRFVRQRVWLWGTLLSAAISYLVFLGPAEVLLPYLVKNELHASAGTLGLVLAAGGVGALGGAAFMGHRGHPRRDVTVMYMTWTIATLAIAGYGIATAAWQLMLVCLGYRLCQSMVRLGKEDRVAHIVRWPDVFAPPFTGNVLEIWIWRMPVLHIDDQPGVVQHAGVSSLEPVIPPPDGLIAPFDLRAGDGVVREGVVPRSDNRL